jgi:hypothetical protein
MTNEQQTLWDQGYRPFEIYTFNDSAVDYFGEVKKAGTVSGWNIKFVFSTLENLKTYPHFDTVIGVDCMASVEDTWHG